MLKYTATDAEIVAEIERIESKEKINEKITPDELSVLFDSIMQSMTFRCLTTAMPNEWVEFMERSDGGSSVEIRLPIPEKVVEKLLYLRDNVAKAFGGKIDIDKDDMNAVIGKFLSIMIFKGILAITKTENKDK